MRPPTIAGAVVALLLVGFFAITGPRAGRSVWFERGSADAARLMAGEWWRTITALTLHADVPHLLGNALATVILVTAVCWNVGPGRRAVAGAPRRRRRQRPHRRRAPGRSHLGRRLHGDVRRHRDSRRAAHRRRPDGASRRKWWVVVAAGLALLALLGTGPHADILAHLFGFLVGGGLGVIAALTLRRPVPALVQWLLVVAAGAVVAVAWRLAR